MEVPGQHLIPESIARWAEAPCEFLSQLTGCTVSNRSAVALVATQLLIVAAWLFLRFDEQGAAWAVVCALLALHTFKPFWKEFRKGGEE